MSTGRMITWTCLVIFILVAIPVGCYQTKRAWNYYMGYEKQVKATVCQMVKPESLKNPEDC